MRSNYGRLRQLDNIKGTGEETKRLLLKEYKSAKRIKEAPDAELEKIIGKHKTTLLRNYFTEKEI